MVHYPSLLVGSAVAGTVCLALYDQISHRSRLSNKSKLRETAEHKVAEAWNQIQKSRSSQYSSQMQSGSPSITQTWNKGVGFLQDALRRDPSPDN